MKCPLSAAIDYGEEGNPKLHIFDCLQEECAWWVENAKRCSIRCNAEALGKLALMAIALGEKD